MARARSSERFKASWKRRSDARFLRATINEGDTVDVGFDENRGELTFAIGEREKATA